SSVLLGISSIPASAGGARFLRKQRSRSAGFRGLSGQRGASVPLPEAAELPSGFERLFLVSFATVEGQREERKTRRPRRGSLRCCETAHVCLGGEATPREERLFLRGAFQRAVRRLRLSASERLLRTSGRRKADSLVRQRNRPCVLLPQARHQCQQGHRASPQVAVLYPPRHRPRLRSPRGRTREDARRFGEFALRSGASPHSHLATPAIRRSEPRPLAATPTHVTGPIPRLFQRQVPLHSPEKRRRRNE
ncbi:putative small subunit DNA primase, partial [Toxoplasma gondii ARI]